MTADFRHATYDGIRDAMQPGDVIAFGGKGRASNLIKWATRGAVSHVGVVLKRRAIDDTSGRYFVEVIESTSLYEVIGVQTTRLSDHVAHYAGEMWWLPLSAEARARLDVGALWEFLFGQVGKGYDVRQALAAGVDAFEFVGLGEASEDFSRFFCSELVAAGLEAAGVIGSINASEVTPIELCRWGIYRECVQFKGSPKRISRVGADPAPGV